MTFEGAAGARLACSWVHLLTRTAEPAVGRDRRAEIASDVYEQLSAAAGDGALSAGSRSVVGRVVRGVPADLAWRIGLELRPERVAWHLKNPSTALTFGFFVMLPLDLVADSAGTRIGQLVDYRIPLWVATDVIGFVLLAFAAMSALARIRRRWLAGAETYAPGSVTERVRRLATAALAVSWAGSALFRFGVVGPIGAVFWAAFGLGLVVYAAVLVASSVHRWLRLGRYLPMLGT